MAMARAARGGAMLVASMALSSSWFQSTMTSAWAAVANALAARTRPVVIERVFMCAAILFPTDSDACVARLRDGHANARYGEQTTDSQSRQ